jgi:Protein of unknown function (DUF1524)
MRSTQILFLLLGVYHLVSLKVHASVVDPRIVITNGQASSGEDFIYSEYRQIKNQDHQPQVNLLNIEIVQKTFPLPTEHYDRKKHFGGWIHFANDTSCLDTRGLVLERDSKAQVDFTGCRITAGQWQDPYTDQDFKLSKDIQIDHVVPLKHAYMTGAFEWTNKKRCQYANYLGNHFHLLSVSGFENMRKGDRGPLEYLPPNQKFTCEYLKDWLEIKYIWNLRVTPKEADQILQIVKKENCDQTEFEIPQLQIDEQKKYMKQNENICVGAALSTF